MCFWWCFWVVKKCGVSFLVETTGLLTRSLNKNEFWTGCMRTKTIETINSVQSSSGSWLQILLCYSLISDLNNDIWGHLSVFFSLYHPPRNNVVLSLIGPCPHLETLFPRSWGNPSQCAWKESKLLLLLSLSVSRSLFFALFLFSLSSFLSLKYFVDRSFSQYSLSLSSLVGCLNNPLRTAARAVRLIVVLRAASVLGQFS